MTSLSGYRDDVMRIPPMHINMAYDPSVIHASPGSRPTPHPALCQSREETGALVASGPHWADPSAALDRLGILRLGVLRLGVLRIEARRQRRDLHTTICDTSVYNV